MSLYKSSGPVYWSQMTFDRVYYASEDNEIKLQISRRKYNAMGEPSMLHVEYWLPKLTDVRVD